MTKNKDTYEILKIALGKLHSTNEASNLDVQYTVLGSYDTLKIVPCKRWHELRPGQNGETASDEYVLRLVRKCNAERSEDGKCCRQYAFIACCLVHISDTSWSDKNYSIVDNFLDPSAIFDFKNSANSKVECWVNLGYPSFVVLIYTDLLSEVVNYVEQIREKSFVSVVHTIIGYSIKKSTSIISDEKISADIDISPDSGVTLYEQYNNILTALSSDFSKKTSVQLMYGSYDFRCRVRDLELNKFIAMHNSVFGLSKTDFCNTTTRIFPPATVNHSIQAHRNRALWEQLDAQVFNAYNQFKTLYNGKLGKKGGEHNAHRRPIDSAERVVALYYQVISVNHSFDVKVVVGEFLVSFFNSASSLIMYMKLEKDNGRVRKIYDSEGKEYTFANYHVLIEHAVNELRKYAGTLLFDIWRSDSAYFEGQTSEHPSVGSAVKLLFAYNSMLSKSDKIWRTCCANIDDEDIYDTDFAYLVTSGGMDITVNCDLFDNNHKILLRYSVNGDGEVVERIPDGGEFKFIRRPIIVVVPEGSLYDINGTQIRMLHEFFHKRGKRKRKPRAMAYYKTMCKIAANILSYVVRARLVGRYVKFVFDNNVYRHIERRTADNGKMVESERYKDLLADFMRIVLSEGAGETQHFTKDELKNFKSDFEAFDRNIYDICKTTFDRLISNVQIVLSNITENELENHIIEISGVTADYSSGADIYYLLYQVFFKNANDSLICENIADCISQCLKEINVLINKKYKDDEDKRFFKNYVSVRCKDIIYCQDIWHDCLRMLINPGQEDVAFIDFTDIEDYNRNFYALTESFKSIFSESYADYMALKTIWCAVGKKGDEINVFDILQ